MIGILNVDKPSGLTSHDVVAVVRRLSRQRKVGHAGTLDPMATGVLLVCIGDATRVSEYLMDSTKTYLATIHLGISTTTDDAEGDTIAETPIQVTREQVGTALASFVGRIEQIPPKYAAIKHRGRKLYELARKGIDVDVPARSVTIHAINIVEVAPPQVRIEVTCGPGTYIRALARDLGQALGCGAHLSALRRTQSGQFRAENAASMEQLDGAFASQTAGQLLLPLDAALTHLPAIHVPLDSARSLALGQAIQGPTAVGPQATGKQAGLARAYAPGQRFVAIVAWDQASARWRPRKVFAQPHDLASPRSQESNHARAQ